MTSFVSRKRPMLRRTIRALLLIGATLAPAQIRANDSTAELATGGLIFTRSPDIEMRSEDLFISMAEIRVQYRFFNHSSRDVVTQVAFPMPDISFGIDSNIAIPTNDPENILGFATTVNGSPVAALVERKALLNGVDKTETLKTLNVPLAPQAGRKQDNLSQETWDRLIRDGLIEDTPRTDGYMTPLWILKTTYHWQQKFPAGREITVSHRYLPSVGGTVPMSASTFLNDPSILQIERAKGTNRFCIDQDFLNAMVRSPNLNWQQNYMEYILVTGANWSGPIREFRMVVDKGAPENLLSFCGQGVRKISPTQFEVRASNFVPNANVNLLIMKPERADPAPVQDGDRPQGVESQNCVQLWQQRNSIFKAGAYCFRTPRAVAAFGNAGCKYDNILDVPLSARDRQLVNDIQRIERIKACPR
ncbi:DUF4424 family protein [Bradyrhizobium cosmicum]|uniref:DUF4424 family protein n=1 Tax=Bradyrhizobium cosmicum TaxID=1404864 RepID=UPI001161D5E6|nr:DUF4424 family protein [Bradyrhizobium cosmicum]QDP26339.1 DUF4424 domain-containing protein [Bradyrhizobium cosmicum]